MTTSIRARLLESVGLGPNPARSAQRIVPEIMRLFAPQTVADIGCGNGSWLVEFATRGCAIRGYDRKWRADHMRIPRECFHEVDLNQGLATAERADVALSLEVAEHLDSSTGDQLVSALVGISDVVIFAAGIPLQGGWGHCNEQWQSYWAGKFSRWNFHPHDDLRQAMWNMEGIAPWYRQDTLIYCTPDTAVRFGLHKAQMLDVVHPQSWAHIGWMGMWKRLLR